MDVLFLGLRRWRLRKRAQRSRPWSVVRGVEQYMSREQTIASLLELQGLLTVSNYKSDRVAEVLPLIPSCLVRAVLNGMVIQYAAHILV